MPVCFSYIRVSTTRQEESEIGEATQRRQNLAQWECVLRHNGWPDPPVEVKDLGVSAGDVEFAKRPGGGELTIRLQPGDCVIVSHLDRAFRNFLDQVNTMERWRVQGVRVLASDFAGLGLFDSASQAGQWINVIVGMCNQMMYNLIKTRNKEKVASSKAAGRKHGGYTPLGFKTRPGKDKTLLPDDAERAKMRWCRRQYAGGASLPEIAAALNKSGRRNTHGRAVRPRNVFDMIHRDRDLCEWERRYDLRPTDAAPHGFYVTPEGVVLPRPWPVPEEFRAELGVTEF